MLCAALWHNNEYIIIIIICPIAIDSMGHYKITSICLSVCLSVRLSVCLSPLLLSQFSLNFDENLHHSLKPKR